MQLYHELSAFIFLTYQFVSTIQARYEVRLTNQTSSSSGRLEVSFDGIWGSICSDGWSNSDATVACRQLGYGSAIGNIGATHMDTIWLSSLSCGGYEIHIGQCSHDGWYDHPSNGCTKGTSIYLECYDTTAEDVDVQLVTTGDAHYGRVEVYHSGTWGTICDDSFTLDNAHVICRQLGYNGAISYDTNTSGSGAIWMDNVICVGNEPNIGLCAHSGWGVHNCSHNEDISVTCDPGLDSDSQTVRLIDGVASNLGRVEVLYGGTWGTVCDTYWGNTEADIACRQLGYDGGIPYSNAFYGQGTNYMVMSPNCEGYEGRLDLCSHHSSSFSSCTHADDAGVECYLTEDVAVRLVDGTTDRNGEVEIWYDGEWGRICGGVWDTESARVVCRQLGFTDVDVLYKLAIFSTGSKIHDINSLDCSGTERYIGECTLTHATFYCASSATAGMKCGSHVHDVISTTESSLSSYSIRLVGGSSAASGRVEVYFDGEWGTVCDDEWDFNDAHVVCRELGFSGAIQAYGQAFFGQGSGEIWVDDVECVGTESSLHECMSNTWGFHNCQHYEDAGVECYTGTYSPDTVRLVGVSYKGRVEVFHDDVWGSVCDDGWEWADADVVCRQLGFSGALAAFSGAEFGEGSGQIWLDDVQCDGNELSLQTCINSNAWGVHNCDHSEDAGVECITSGPCQSYDPCINGLCENLAQETLCVCRDGWIGEFCEEGSGLSPIMIIIIVIAVVTLGPFIFPFARCTWNKINKTTSRTNSTGTSVEPAVNQATAGVHTNPAMFGGHQDLNRTLNQSQFGSNNSAFTGLYQEDQLSFRPIRHTQWEMPPVEAFTPPISPPPSYDDIMQGKPYSISSSVPLVNSETQETSLVNSQNQASTNTNHNCDNPISSVQRIQISPVMHEDNVPPPPYNLYDETSTPSTLVTRIASEQNNQERFITPVGS